jgi:Late exocytosis, associated with Golgi transport/Cytosolic domain of 10TM putative phosphate transporter
VLGWVHGGTMTDASSLQNTTSVVGRNTTSPLMTNSDNNNNSTIVRETLRLYGTLYVACFLLYILFLKRRYPKLFNVRSWTTEEETQQQQPEDGNDNDPPPPPPPSLAQTQYATSYSWLYQVFTLYTDDQLQDHCGMDAVCFLRALRFGRELSLVGCCNAIWLIPMYYTVPHSNDQDSSDVDPLTLISVANLPSYSNRFIGTVLAAYITYLYAMYLIYLEYKWFTVAKHKFLSTKSPRNYSVYVSGIPRAYRSSQQLANYFRQCSKGSVLEAHIAMETPKLDKMIERRKVLIQKLEHSVAYERKTGKVGTHHTLVGRNVTLRKVESVLVFEDELAQLNCNITRAIHDILGNTESNNNNGNSCTAVSSSGSLQWPTTNRPHLLRHAASKDLIRAIKADVRSDDNNDDNSSSAEDYVYDGYAEDDNTSEYSKGLLQRNNGSEIRHPVVGAALEACGNIYTANDGNIPSLDVIGEVSVEESWSKDDNVKGLASAEAKDESDHSEDSQNDDIEQAKELDQIDTPDSSSRSSQGSFRYSFRQSMLSGTNVVTGSLGKAGMTLVSSSKIAGSTIVKSSIIAGTTIAKSSKVAGATLIQTASDTGVETLRRAQFVGNHVVHSAGAVVPLLRNKTEGRATDSGFVVFTSLYATQTALQMVCCCFVCHGKVSCTY